LAAPPRRRVQIWPPPLCGPAAHRTHLTGSRPPPRRAPWSGTRHIRRSHEQLHGGVLARSEWSARVRRAPPAGGPRRVSELARAGGDHATLSGARQWRRPPRGARTALCGHVLQMSATHPEAGTADRARPAVGPRPGRRRPPCVTAAVRAVHLAGRWAAKLGRRPRWQPEVADVLCRGAQSTFRTADWGTLSYEAGGGRWLDRRAAGVVPPLEGRGAVGGGVDACVSGRGAGRAAAARV
jgi:hypothetical protein